MRLLYTLLALCLTLTLSAQTTLIHAVQGSGNATQLAGQTVTIEAIVVADFQRLPDSGLGGFYVQEEDAEADADPLTSEGLFVYDGTFTTDVRVGDKVRVTGTASEFEGLTQVNATVAGGSVTVVARDETLPTPAGLELPVTADSDYERIEGMLTRLVANTYITEVFGVGRYGEFQVTDGQRLVQFTECNAPDVASFTAYKADQARRRLTVDDGRGGENRFPIVLGNGQTVTAANTLRAGARVTGLTGVIEQRFTDGYRMQATGFTVEDDNPRPTSAPTVGGNIRVVGMNVLNYFTTLDSRGADDAEEFERQEAKIVNAICELNADVLGLVEIENNGFGANGAIRTLIAAVREKCGLEYEAVVNPNPGSDQIMVALIYKSSVVSESGTAANLSEPANLFQRNRVPLAQTFRVTDVANPDYRHEFTVCVNHWKSKGSDCGAGDDDTGGAGNCDGTRTAVATAIRDWLAPYNKPTGTTDADVIIIGDLNAYSEEQPIKVMTDAGYVNTVRASSGDGSFPCGSSPSYVFMGEWGSLDHGLASASLAAQVTGAAPWNVNAPEPIALDYDTRFNDASLYADDFYRFSDHDPVVIGLDLEGTIVSVTDTGEAGLSLQHLGNREFRISGADAGAKLVLLEASGRTLKRGKLRAGTTVFSAGKVPAGIYFLRVVARDGRAHTFKVLIQ